MHHEFLLEMVPVVVVLARIDVPRAKLIAIDTVVVLVADPRGPVVLGNVGPVGQLPRLVLDLGAADDLGERGKGAVLDVGPSVGKGRVVQPPQRPELTQRGEGMVHKVLVRADQVLEDHPVEVALLGGELDIEEVLSLCFSFAIDFRRGPVQVGYRAVCHRLCWWRSMEWQNVLTVADIVAHGIPYQVLAFVVQLHPVLLPNGDIPQIVSDDMRGIVDLLQKGPFGVHADRQCQTRKR